jgi:deazaflavin-dependent oxidoreductase (nitroreductase family)
MQSRSDLLTLPIRQMLPAELTRAPIFLWRMGLAPIIGQALMLITTVGRRSGLPRRAAIDYFFVNGRKYVYGESEAQWYQNGLADPRATIQTAFGTEHVTLRPVRDPGELTEVFAALLNNRPAFAARIFKEIGAETFPADLIARAGQLRLLTFDPSSAPTPPPLEVDLPWMLPIAFLGMLIGWRLVRTGRR